MIKHFHKKLLACGLMLAIPLNIFADKPIKGAAKAVSKKSSWLREAFKTGNEGAIFAKNVLIGAAVVAGVVVVYRIYKKFTSQDETLNAIKAQNEELKKHRKELAERLDELEVQHREDIKEIDEKIEAFRAENLQQHQLTRTEAQLNKEEVLEAVHGKKRKEEIDRLQKEIAQIDTALKANTAKINNLGTTSRLRLEQREKERKAKSEARSKLSEPEPTPPPKRSSMCSWIPSWLRFSK
jgi:hypothetical protein